MFKRLNNVFILSCSYIKKHLKDKYTRSQITKGQGKAELGELGMLWEWRIKTEQERKE